ncbi:hypothetical protein EGW08_016080 [Elysia chlorotica]|uniref:L-Fucosyltransferase n=1 Tax=Elysia chlorotica TaxID=188477 RepID=A0A433T3N6_ELYCH|nr:hypothetical protein EGW08_016080 [Elysia chlorotica]
MHGVITFDRSRCEQAADASNFKRGIYDEGFLKRITGKEDIKLRGFFQSYKYFERWEREVRDVLAFREDVLTKAMEAINILHFRKLGTSLYHSDTAEALDLVGVHVRRYPADRRRREGLGYRTAPEDYVSFAMSEMKAWILNRDSPPDVRFFVVTDDPAWAESKLGLKALPDTMLVKGLDWAANLALLASMDDVIVTVGALGWWGAWLADGRSMYYQDFVKPGSEMDSAYLANDFFPPYWLGMS